MEKEQVINNIKKAFKNVPFPGNTPDDIGIAPWHFDDEHMEGFLGKRWQDINAEFLKDGRESSLSVMTSKALRYYLPAFILCGLEDGTACFNHTVLCALSPWDVYGDDIRDEDIRRFIDRFDSLSQAQKKAIRDYLIYRSEVDDEVNRKGSILALEHYWQDFKLK